MDMILLIIALGLFIAATFIIKSAREKLSESKSLLTETMKEYVKVLTLYRDLMLICKHEELHRYMAPQVLKEWLHNK